MWLNSLPMMNGHCSANLAPNFGSIFTRSGPCNIYFHAAHTSHCGLHDVAEQVRLDELNA
jgi:hypothetical protein